MKKMLTKRLLLVALSLPVFSMMAGAADMKKIELHAFLVGVQEVAPPSTTVVTDATGRFTATINDDSTLTYTVTYNNLSSAVLQSHIHIGATKVAGSITIFLCSNLGNGPADTPACPDDATHSGTVSRTVSAADVTNLAAAQGVPAGDFKDVVRAIVSHVTYANVHSANFPAGELRGQIHSTPDPQDELPGANDQGQCDH
ncbi:MAG: CHRD domain-containing protein [Candidatus Sulfotelmatobacter sp.]